MATDIRRLLVNAKSRTDFVQKAVKKLGITPQQAAGYWTYNIDHLKAITEEINNEGRVFYWFLVIVLSIIAALVMKGLVD